MNDFKKRRSKGDGSIRELVKGERYRVCVDITQEGDATRKRRYLSVRGSLTDARKKLKELSVRANEGGLAGKETALYSELVANYLAAVKSSQETTTYECYERAFRNHIVPALGKIQVRKLCAEHVQKMLDSAMNRSTRKAAGSLLSGLTRGNLLVFTRASLEWGVVNDYCIKNVAKRVKPPRVAHVERKAIDLDLAREIVDAVKGSRIEVAVATALGTGLRRGELVGWKWKDVDLRTGVFCVKRSVANVDLPRTNGGPKRGLEIKDVKSRKSQRTDVLAAFVLAVLNRHREQQDALLSHIGASTRDGERHVFEQSAGKMWDPNELSRQFSRLMRKAKIEGIRFHDLRHGFATLSFASGAPLQVVSESLGHSQISVTAGIYIHTLSQSKRDRALALDAFMGTTVVPVE